MVYDPLVCPAHSHRNISHDNPLCKKNVMHSLENTVSLTIAITDITFVAVMEQREKYHVIQPVCHGHHVLYLIFNNCNLHEHESHDSTSHLFPCIIPMYCPSPCPPPIYCGLWNCRWYIDGLVQEIRNSIVLAMELRLSRTNPSTCRYRETQFTTKVSTWAFIAELLSGVLCRKRQPRLLCNVSRAATKTIAA